MLNLAMNLFLRKQKEILFGNESDSSKSEEPSVEIKSKISVPPMDNVNFPPLQVENLKQKVGNQFYSEKKELMRLSMTK
ncbi:hypothetical protein Hanom_Chr03g00195681 [Helianthus anomalus]